MSTNWKERWEEKDVDGDTVVDVWEIDGQPVAYMWDATGGVKVSPEVICLIPRKPTPVVVPWEPDEVPVGAVVRMKNDKDSFKCGVISHRSEDLFYVDGYRYVTAGELFDQFVIHQPGVSTEQCQPCGKVVRS